MDTLAVAYFVIELRKYHALGLQLRELAGYNTGVCNQPIWFQVQC